MGLFLDCAWLYLLSLARCVGELRAAHVSDLKGGLSQYLAGGGFQLKQKREIAHLLEELRDARNIPSTVSISVDPRFFTPLLETSSSTARCP